MSETESVVRRAVRAGMLSEPLDNPAAVHLVGSKCADCGEVTLGANNVCPNCGGENVEAQSMSDCGTLWTYTVVRHEPPGNYYGKKPFEPIVLGMVELPEGLIVMAPVNAPVDSVKIGMPLQFRAFVREDDLEDEVVSFVYDPVEEA